MLTHKLGQAYPEHAVVSNIVLYLGCVCYAIFQILKQAQLELRYYNKLPQPLKFVYVRL